MGPIQRVAVLGSGVMGAGIAAHLANAGIPSLMLDRVPPNLEGEDRESPKQRNSLALAARKGLLKTTPAPLFLPSDLDLIEVGNFEDDLHRIADCDWIIEVVTEDLAIKRALFAEVAKHRTPGTLVSTNTSGIPIGAIAGSMPEEMRSCFLGTHFFNPPRYLKLLELIPLPETLPEAVALIADFGENVLGKGIVYAKDTPNFIANRLLTFSMQWILHHVREAGLSVEEVDALTGPAIGHAKSATFRTADLVGLDTFQRVVGNVYRGCPEDEQRDLMRGPDWFGELVNKGWLGDKTGSGFYQKTDERDEKGRRIIRGLDLGTLEYRAPVKPRFPCTGEARKLDDLKKKLHVMHFGEDPGARFVFSLFANMAQYTGNRIPEIADDIVNIDNALKWGFAWEVGIFETWDLLGFEAVCMKMAREGIELPAIARALREAGGTSFYITEHGVRKYFDLATKGYRPVPEHRHALRLNLLRDEPARVVRHNAGCDLVDLGDGVLCAVFHTKMNAVDGDIIAALNDAVDLLEADTFEGLVIGNQAAHFSAGANLQLVLGGIMQQDWDGIGRMIDGFHGVGRRMKYCRKPVVAAPHHFTLGGGLELCLHTDRCVVAAETYSGLVEAGVGVIPGGGGTKEMLVRALECVPPTVETDPFPFLRRAFENIAMAKVSGSGPELIHLGYLRNSDVVELNLDHQLSRAKRVCQAMSMAGYAPPRPPKLVALGEPARAAFRAAVYGMQRSGWASEHDALIAEKLAHVLTGGDRLPGTAITEQQVLELEKEAFLSLCGTEKTRARIEHMLANGKPLRN